MFPKGNAISDLFGSIRAGTCLAVVLWVKPTKNHEFEPSRTNLLLEAT